MFRCQLEEKSVSQKASERQTLPVRPLGILHERRGGGRVFPPLELLFHLKSTVSTVLNRDNVFSHLIVVVCPVGSVKLSYIKFGKTQIRA